MESVLRAPSRGPGLSALIQALLGSDQPVRAQGLRGSSRAFVLARLLREFPRTYLVLTPTLSEARRLAAEVRFFLGEADDPEHPGAERVTLLPAWETSPFDAIPPLPEVSARRIAALARLERGGPLIAVAPVTAALQRTLPPGVLRQATRTVEVGGELARDGFVEHLVAAGYHRVGQVSERGEVSVRGGIVDLFPPFYPRPVRIELFGDEVESIRSFDPETQRSVGRMERVVVLPAREALAGPSSLDEAARRLRARCRELGLSRAETAEALEAFRTQAGGVLREVFFAYLYERAAALWEYLPTDAVLVREGAAQVAVRARDALEDAETAHRRAAETGRPVPRVGDVFVGPEEWEAFSASGTRLDLEELEVEGAGGRAVPFRTRSNDGLVSELRRRRGEHLLEPLVEAVAEARGKGQAVWLVARTRGSAQRLADLLGGYDVLVGEPEPFPAEPQPDGGVHLAVGELERGFRFPAKGLWLVTDTEILGEKVRRRPPRRREFRSTLADLRPGDPVVHVDFGVGLYRGLVHLEAGGEEGDYLHLEYAGGDRLYLPVTRIGLVQRYSAPGEGAIRLDKLGGTAWQKARAKAQEGIERVAHELLEIYARRQLAERPPYAPPDLAYREFESTFPYEETPDQQAAIDAVMADLSGPRPMDRLVCGDVGYGKTEVAIRAAFRAVHDGRQVAILVPTTVLAAQHFQTFRRRFEGHPFTVAMLSRFVSPAEQKKVLQGLEQGSVDIVVGTHRLLQRDVRFRSLGLVVVDEEHRFGVAQKERLKKLRARVDVLTLTATPIPRTLNLSLSGVRDLSVIETPPADRLAVRTVVARDDDDLVREAIRRELARGGQVYFVHNRVQTIAEVVERVRELVPEARVGLGHGQMKEAELERAMEAFVAGQVDVFVCTAIVESGLDIPRANTIIIDRADRFGLADLYQLRGRVGRSNLRAYCYLLVPAEAELTPEARKRLQVLQEFSELGAGFRVATHDLEIRGAGEMLGKAQSGHIAAIGFELYSELLDQAVRRLKGEPAERPPEPEIRLKVPAHFPADYVPDAAQRLELYERLTRVRGPDEIDDLRYEIVDRFGPVPLPVDHLLEIMKLRLGLLALRAVSLDYTGANLVVAFDERPAVDPDRIVGLVQQDPRAYRITPDNRVVHAVGHVSGPAVIAKAREFLERLGAPL
ncbi:transcription-repair coupling factor [Deferrisoma camini]|uniref:transcription-repair coupling factor n=1 Tax=Deferrisoma camini TaxID=1035120 RepID=UPI00046CFA77|nr:transcription-repair coupling factor [Deferrisoma camini]